MQLSDDDTAGVDRVRSSRASGGGSRAAQQQPKRRAAVARAARGVQRGEQRGASSAAPKQRSRSVSLPNEREREQTAGEQATAPRGGAHRASRVRARPPRSSVRRVPAVTGQAVTGQARRSERASERRRHAAARRPPAADAACAERLERVCAAPSAHDQRLKYNCANVCSRTACNHNHMQPHAPDTPTATSPACRRAAGGIGARLAPGGGLLRRGDQVMNASRSEGEHTPQTWSRGSSLFCFTLLEGAPPH